ncbi:MULTISPECIES: MFS transporter [unclassified Streptomyces]|uniref:MFS transporter n=1 Tax=unclassified Streptomyces TaxID=2593676 RepID=UPI0001C1A81E|nr:MULTISPECIES: MFS transporter [unclassified Streptomyces]AEN10251.1 major facilitator superfamily MFS_1 [Streptomyces sp. SirexAA-E]MYR66897.1 MFS transporter [Streptomyces sp. SID4939]MYR98878.1 MFS transporter [Streptomyces sp. SID4940]MYT65402.1 MFS transporter [Streptomyces sp. SID8357]MYT84457.1 MFS transporter [Streptomyces sp. SID8360]
MTASAPAAAPAHPRFALGVLAFCGVVVAIMQTLVVPLLPHIPELTGATPAAASWLVTVTLLTGAVFTPVLGRVGDMYGKRRVLLVSLGLLVAGSVLCAISSHIGVLIAGRALQGAAIAVVPLGISILRDELPPERVLSAVALMSSSMGIGAAVGLPIAAVVIQNFEWHTMFWVSGAIGLLDIVLVLRCVPESPLRTRGRFDAPGALGLTAALVCLLLAVTQGGGWGWTSPLTLGLLVASVAIALVWGAYELRVRTPMVDLRVSARPAVLLTNVAALLIGFAFYANSLVTAQMVQEPRSTGYGLGASLVVSGLCLLPGGVTMVLLSPVSARISAKHGPKTSLGLAAGVIAVGYGVRFFTSHSLWLIIAGATVVAAGTAIAYSALPALVMRGVPAGETGAANGLNTLMRSVGQAFCSATVAAVLADMTFVAGGRTAPTLGAYQLVFVIAAVAAVLALVVTLCMPRGRADTGTVEAARENTGRTRAVPIQESA